jgi:hypothetical protein
MLIVDQLRLGGWVGPQVWRAVRGTCPFVLESAVVSLAWSCSRQGSRGDGHDGFNYY